MIVANVDKDMNSNQPKQQPMKEPKQKGPAVTTPTPVGDQWRHDKVYKDAHKIFEAPPPVATILKQCLFVFDASALLAPYESDAAALNDIRKCLEPLANEKRLYVPGRALREFAHNRGGKLTEVAEALDAKKRPNLDSQPVPFIDTLKSHPNFASAERKLGTALEEYNKSLQQLVDDVATLNFADKVTALYSKLFPSDRVIEPKTKQEEMEKDFAWRTLCKVPPGFEDKHIGDLVIWNCVLELGSKMKSNVIFVTNDMKEDWVHTLGEIEPKRITAARYELVFEFSEKTNGQHFAVMRFSDFLTFFKATKATVEAVKTAQGTAPRLQPANFKWMMRLACEWRGTVESLLRDPNEDDLHQFVQRLSHQADRLDSMITNRDKIASRQAMDLYNMVVKFKHLQSHEGSTTALTWFQTTLANFIDVQTTTYGTP